MAPYAENLPSIFSRKIITVKIDNNDWQLDSFSNFQKLLYDYCHAPFSSIICLLNDIYPEVCKLESIQMQSLKL